MAGLNPLPTHVRHSTTRLTHREAHSMLSTFLERSENDAAYRPDSTLTEQGPQSASTGANPNLTLHHLKLILQGIEGKRVGGDLAGLLLGENKEEELADMNGVKRKRGGEEQQEEGSSSRRQKVSVGNFDGNVDDSTNAGGGEGVGILAAEDSEGWQEKDDYDLAQEDDGVQVMADDRQPGITLDQPDNARQEQELLEVRNEETGEKIQSRANGDNSFVQVDEEEEKNKRKQKRKEEKKAKAGKRSKNG